MGKKTAWILAGLFTAAVTMPGIAMAACGAQHSVTADATPTATSSKTTSTVPVTPAPGTKAGG